MDENQDREGRVIRTIPADTFAHRLLLIRAERGITLREAAEKCGLNYGSWNGWERGSMPRDKVEVAEAIAEGLNVDRDWLLHGGPLTAPVKARRVRLPYHRRSLRPVDRTEGRRARRLDRVSA